MNLVPPTALRWISASIVFSIVVLTGSSTHHFALALDQEATPTVLITGSNRGIGLEFARQYAEVDWTVIATARDPKTADDLNAIAAEHENLIVEELDVTDVDEITALVEKYKGTPIDVLINNAGILGAPENQTLGNLDYETFQTVMAVNLYGPLKMADAFLENVAASEQKKIVTITSGLASISRTQSRGGLYYYRMSKAGVNMAMRNLQAQVRERGILVGILAPGVVDTRLLAQSGFSGPGALTPEESVLAVRNLIDALSPENAASYTLYTGESLPW